MSDLADVVIAQALTSALLAKAIARRIGVLEHDMREVKQDIREMKSDISILKSDMAVVKSHMESFATKADLADLKSSLIQWMVGMMVSVAAIAFAIARYSGS
jgi:hypothetical protein